MFMESPRFPDDIAAGSSGGPNYNTTIIEFNTGLEQRNVNWTLPLHTFDVSFGVRTRSQLDALVSFFHVAQGKIHSFRFKNHSDYQSCTAGAEVTATDQVLGTGDGGTNGFQLVKRFTIGEYEYLRTITKPVEGTVKVAIAGVELTTGWSLSSATGMVFFTDCTRNISGITNTHPCMITSHGHGLGNGCSVVVTGVSGMAEINGVRSTITVLDSDNFLFDGVDTTGFSTYGGGGTCNTLPQSGEVVSAGFEFDLVCRFDTDQLEITQGEPLLASATVPLIEVRMSVTPATMGNSCSCPGVAAAEIVGCCVVAGSNGKILFSNDAITWEEVSSPTTSLLRNGYYYTTPGLWVMVGGSGQWVAGSDDPADNVMLVSVDGRQWNLLPVSSPMNLQTVLYGERWIAVGSGNQLRTSTTGILWSSGSGGMGGSSIISLGYRPGWGYVAGGYSGKIAYSTDGSTWHAVTSTHNYSVRTVCWGGNQWIVAGAGGEISSSENGSDWTPGSPPFGVGGGHVNSLAYGNLMWVAVGTNGQLATSTDGTTWTTRVSAHGSSEIQTVHFIEYVGMWVAVGADGKISSSKNGREWTLRYQDETPEARFSAICGI